MVWFIDVRKHRDGYYTRCADSDEGGGFVEGCDHKHKTFEEADACEDAREKCSMAAGFPNYFSKKEKHKGWSPTDEDLSRIYKEANGEITGKAYPITTKKIFQAMRQMLVEAKEIE